eukprot:COSAG04_NODE_30024_length_265_cov_0.626506_1_plen_26_part_01
MQPERQVAVCQRVQPVLLARARRRAV